MDADRRLLPLDRARAVRDKRDEHTNTEGARDRSGEGPRGLTLSETCIHISDSLATASVGRCRCFWQLRGFSITPP
jgi:hypothetical protein